MFSRKLFKESYLLIAIILLLSLLLRLYKAEQLFIFSGDEEHQMSLAYSLVKDFHIEWVGVSSADTGFYLGPFWIYFGAFWLFLSKGNPAILAYIPPMIGAMTTLIIYLAAKKMFNRNVALMSALLYAVLPLMVFYDRKFWNPLPTTITSVLLMFSLYMTKYSNKWWVGVLVIAGFIFHVHLSLVPLGLIVGTLLISNYKKTNIKMLMLGLGLFVVVVSPILAFDYFTGGTNIKTPLRMLKQVEDRPDRFQPRKHADHLRRSISRLWYVPQGSEISDQLLHSCNPNFVTSNTEEKTNTTSYSDSIVWIVILPIVSLLWLILKKENWEKYSSKLLISFILTLLVSYIMLPNIALEYYLLAFFPLSLIAFALFWDSQRGIAKKALNILTFIVVFLALISSLTITSDYGLDHKRQLIKQVSLFIQDDKYELNAEGLCHKFEGWRFLSARYGKLPVRSFTDKSFSWIYEDEISNDPARYEVVYVESRSPYVEKSNLVKKTTQGGFSAYIYEKGSKE